MIMKDEKSMEILEQKPELKCCKIIQNDDLNPKLQKKPNLKQENRDINNIKDAIYPKPNNETSSKFSSTSKSLKDTYNDLKELKNFLQRESPYILEKFELLEIIKSGSAGSVVKALPKLKGKKGKIIALKFLTNGKEKDNKNIQNHDEIIIHGSLKHHNIPQIYGYYKVGNNSCIAMEISQYGDLDSFKRKVIKRIPLSETLICYIFGGLVQALHYIHTHNKIIHMDVKQQNVLVDDYINIKLTDFSVSVCYKNIKKIKLPMVGTCYYMSPEVLRKDTIDSSDASRIDVYSLGVLLYLLAFCGYPYNLNNIDNKDYKQILMNVEKNKLEFPRDSGNSRIFLDLLENCLNKDLKKRYSIYQLMNHPFYQAYQIILDEKEKLYNAAKFIVDLMVDNIHNFNKFIKNKENEYFL